MQEKHFNRNGLILIEIVALCCAIIPRGLLPREPALVSPSDYPPYGCLETVIEVVSVLDFLLCVVRWLTADRNIRATGKMFLVLGSV